MFDIDLVLVVVDIDVESYVVEVAVFGDAVVGEYVEGEDVIGDCVVGDVVDGVAADGQVLGVRRSRSVLGALSPCVGHCPSFPHLSSRYARGVPGTTFVGVGHTNFELVSSTFVVGGLHSVMRAVKSHVSEGPALERFRDAQPQGGAMHHESMEHGQWWRCPTLCWPRIGMPLT